MRKLLLKIVAAILFALVFTTITACNNTPPETDEVPSIKDDNILEENPEEIVPDETPEIDEPSIEEDDELVDDEILSPDEEIDSDKENTEEIQISKEAEIIEYLNMVHKKNIERVWFSTYSNITQYYGYIFLYHGNKVTPKQEYVNIKYKSTRPGITRTKIDYIVIHDTGNNASSANAQKHSNYINSNPGVSWHYTVDMEGVFHQIPDNEVAYHAGDGLKPSGSYYYNSTYKKTSITGGNMNGIGIETCVNSGSDYTTTLFNTANLVSDLMIKYDLDIDDVKRHYDFSGKMCPQALIKSGSWDDFLDYVMICYYYKTKLYDVSIEFISMSKYMDNSGRVNIKTPKGTKINYKAVIKYEGQVLEYEFASQVI